MSGPSDDDLAFATRVVEMHGGRADEVVALPGVVNRVLRVTGVGQDWVIRFPADPGRPNEFPTEVWAAHQASRFGIDTPRVLALGYLDGRPYLVVEYIRPQPEPAAAQLWWWLGRYAATLATVPLDEAPEELFSRFGRDLPSAWRSHLRYNLDELSERDPLIEDLARWARDRRPDLYDQYRQSSHHGLRTILAAS